MEIKEPKPTKQVISEMYNLDVKEKVIQVIFWDNSASRAIWQARLNPGKEDVL